MDQQHQIGGPDMGATILAKGAELCSLRAAGEEYLWQAGPIWPHHAPVLFPIVGRLPNDSLTVEGTTHRMTQHGFARDREFEWVERAADHCRLALVDDAQTRASYPFRFRFEVAYAITRQGLTMRFTASNTGDVTLPASIGAHPAFRWPLPGNPDKDAYALTFETEEPAPIRRVVGGLMQPDGLPSPVVGRTLPLTPALFDADALIFDRVASHSVRFAAPGSAALVVAWENCPYLGVWTKGGGDYLCIEPWHGISTPEGFDAEFATKLGLMLIPPGEQRSIEVSVRVEPAQG